MDLRENSSRPFESEPISVENGGSLRNRKRRKRPLLVGISAFISGPKGTDIRPRGNGSPGEIRTPVSRLLQPLFLRGSRAD